MTDPRHGQHPPSDPWAHDSATMAYAQPGGTAVYEELAHAGVVPAARRRSRTPILFAVTLVVSLALGVAAYAGASAWYGWGNTMPERVLPGSSGAFARVDLSPGLGQRLKLSALAKKFDESATSGNVVDRIKRDLIGGLGLSPLTYNADVRPWFGNRIGYAIWSGPDGSPCTLAALASDSDGKARAAMTRVRDAKGSDKLRIRLRRRLCGARAMPGRHRQPGVGGRGDRRGEPAQHGRARRIRQRRG